MAFPWGLAGLVVAFVGLLNEDPNQTSFSGRGKEFRYSKQTEELSPHNIRSAETASLKAKGAKLFACLRQGVASFVLKKTSRMDTH